MSNAIRSMLDYAMKKIDNNPVHAESISCLAVFHRRLAVAVASVNKREMLRHRDRYFSREGPVCTVCYFIFIDQV